MKLVILLTLSCVVFADWTSEDLCVLKAGSKCPTGFREKELRMSIQPDVNPKDTDSKGDALMELGVAGASSLTYEQYDRLYTLTLVTCCRPGIL